MNDSTTLSYSSSQGTTFTLSGPKYVGYWEVVPNVNISINKMPNKFHQFMMKLIFGWKFIPNTETKTTSKQLLKG